MAELTLPAHVQGLRAEALSRELTWTEDGDGTPAPAGDIGGDTQVGEAYSRAWLAELPTGLFARTEIAFYVGDGPATEAELDPLVIHQQTEYLICRDPADPGGTEENAEYTYEVVDTYLRPIDDNARELCAGLDVADAEWPGHPEPVVNLFALYALPPVTTYAHDGKVSTTRVFIGEVCIGTVFTVSTGDANRYEHRHLAQRHDWDNEGPIPLRTLPTQPGPDYDPIDLGVFQDPAEAIREIITAVPARLTKALLGTDAEVQTT